MSAGVLASVNVGGVREGEWAGRLQRTGIDKRAVSGPVEIGELGLAGDAVVDQPNHGGVHQAVYAFGVEDAAFWQRELDRPLWPGAFGENLTTEGLEVSGAEIGERWQLGGVLLEATSPRIPCRTFAGFWDVPDLIRRFTEHGRPGAYFRVLRTGAVRAGDRIEVVHRPGHGVTMALAMRARTGETDLAPRLRELPDLPPKWTAWLDRVLT